MADLTLISGNPARRIQDQYQDLMGTHCLTTLQKKALQIVEEGGISDGNARKFKQVVSTTRTVPQLHKYLTNFVLAGAGLAVTAGSR